MPRYFIRISYNGKNYNGWQVQGNAPTVQKALNEALSVIFKEEIHTIGAGRTDTGVHASEFYAHFDLLNSETMHALSLQSIVYKLNGILPIDISVSDILPVRDNANARFDALSRTYKYYISREKDPFSNDFSCFLYGNLDVELMNKAAMLLMKYTDFTSFAKLHSNTKTNNCKITYAQWNYEQRTTNNEQLIFTITADRFLRNMVRAIVGTLLDVGRNKIDLIEFENIIKSKNRSDAGYSVPAHALFLTNIKYPEDIFI
jgi:tRNA pseudouridine38-40 synthase